MYLLNMSIWMLSTNTTILGDIAAAKHDDVDIAMFNSFVEDVFYDIKDKSHIILDGHSSDNTWSLSHYTSFYIVEPSTNEIRERYIFHSRSLQYITLRKTANCAMIILQINTVGLLKRK